MNHAGKGITKKKKQKTKENKKVEDREGGGGGREIVAECSNVFTRRTSL